MATNISVTSKPLTSITHAAGIIVIILTFLAGVQLFIFSEQTEQFFAWTIGIPLTAASLGAGYWAALVPTLVGIRNRSWTNTRSIVVIGFTATVLMLIATLSHLDKFHHTQPISLAWVAAWVWIIIYLLAPFMFFAMIISQWRTSGQTAPRVQPLPVWARVVFGVQALFAVGVGLALFLALPDFMAQWSWVLTPLTARTLGAWLTASGVAAAVVAYENDSARAQGTLYGLVTFGILELIAVLRYTAAINWSNALAWAYVVYLTSHVLVSGYLGWTHHGR